MTPYITCPHCERDYRSGEELVELHLAALKDLGIEPEYRDGFSDSINVCPECSHDFF